MKNIWITKDGNHIKYENLKDDHLLNIIKFIIKKSKEGLKIIYGDDGQGSWEPFYDEEIIYGDDVKEHFNFYLIVKEATTRKKIDWQLYKQVKLC